MCGWATAAAACASAANRRSRFLSAASAAGNTFSATWRLSDGWTASYTTPIPPRPTSRTISNSPSRSPGFSPVSSRRARFVPVPVSALAPW